MIRGSTSDVSNFLLQVLMEGAYSYVVGCLRALTRLCAMALHAWAPFCNDFYGNTASKMTIGDPGEVYEIKSVRPVGSFHLSATYRY